MSIREESSQYGCSGAGEGPCRGREESSQYGYRGTGGDGTLGEKQLERHGFVNGAMGHHNEEVGQLGGSAYLVDKDNPDIGSGRRPGTTAPAR